MTITQRNKVIKYLMNKCGYSYATAAQFFYMLRNYK